MDEFIDGWARIVTVIPSAGVSSKKALLRADIKPSVELVVVDWL